MAPNMLVRDVRAHRGSRAVFFSAACKRVGCTERSWTWLPSKRVTQPSKAKEEKRGLEKQGNRLLLSTPSSSSSETCKNYSRRASLIVGSRTATFLLGFEAVAQPLLGLPRNALAAENEGKDVKKQKRPKGYDKVAKELAKTIRDTIELEASGASVSEIRRSGDPVKSLYRELLTKYDSDARVNKDVSYTTLTDALLELGTFYRANGPTAHLTKAVQDSLLEKLQLVEKSLEEGVK